MKTRLISRYAAQIYDFFISRWQNVYWNQFACAQGVPTVNPFYMASRDRSAHIIDKIDKRDNN